MTTPDEGDTSRRFLLPCIINAKTCFIMAAEKKSANRIEGNSTPNEGEIDRLRRDIYRPDMDKLRLFTQMLRANALFKKAKITHK